MVWFYAFLIMVGCFMIIFRTHWVWSLRRARRKGLFPEKGQGTMFDVRRLITKGEKDLAIQLYCELFSVNRREAKKAVEDLEKTIQEKKPGLE